jgi:hypothetical protein
LGRKVESIDEELDNSIIEVEDDIRLGEMSPKSDA